MEVEELQGNPLVTHQAAAVIDGVHTEFVLTRYANLVFVAVTQRRRLGSLMVVSKDDAVGDANERTYTIRPLLGQRSELLLDVLAKQVAQLVNKSASVPVLFSVALDKPSHEGIRAVLQLLEANKVW
eukprot:m.301659 g.301659  ORF g.301659 m.301659 type:complete len:127 (-) comp14879_c0_seq1:61-441(-)